MCAGLFRHFGHVFTFEALDPKNSQNTCQTRLIDEFSFESPFGPIGSLLDRLVLRPRMKTAATARVQFLKRVAESQEWRQYLADVPHDEGNYVA